MMSEAFFEPNRPVEGTLKYPFTCMFQHAPKNTVAAYAHWHYYFEMLYALSGKARVYLNSKNYNFQKGDFILINVREVHSIVASETEGIEYICTKFDPELLYSTSKLVFESKYIIPFMMNKCCPQSLFLSKVIINTPIPSLIEEMLQEFTLKKYGFEIAMKNNIGIIFLWILRNWESQGLVMDTTSHINKRDIKILQDVFDYLDKNYMHDITVKSIAQRHHLSYNYFSRHFKEIMEMSLSEYLNYIRITEAEKLLLSTNLNVTQVAFETGFSNTSYFIQQFKHFKSVTPKQYKKAIEKV